MSWIAVGGSAVSAGISAISGLSKKAKAKRMAKDNVRPTYQIPEEILKNQKLAEQTAQQGLTPEAYAKQERDIKRGTTQAIGSATDRRSGAAEIGGIQQRAADASLNLNATDASMKLANIRSLMSANQTLAGYRDKEFGYNKQANYEENAAAIRALQGAGSTESESSLNTFLGGAATAAGSFIKKDKIKPDMFNQISSFMSNRGKVDPSLIPNNDIQKRGGPINTDDTKMRKFQEDPLADDSFYPSAPQGIINFNRR